MNRFWANLRRNYEQGRISPLLIVGLGILLSVVLFGLIGPFFTDATNAQVGAVRPRRPPGDDYLLGTDSQVRDMWALLIYARPNTLNTMDSIGQASRGPRMAITAFPTKDTITAASGWDQCNSRNPQTISAIQVTNAARDSQTQKVDAASEAGRISGAGLLEWMKAPIESSTIAVK
jgi:hypothetical protein